MWDIADVVMPALRRVCATRSLPDGNMAMRDGVVRRVAGLFCGCRAGANPILAQSGHSRYSVFLMGSSDGIRVVSLKMGLWWPFIFLVF